MKHETLKHEAHGIKHQTLRNKILKGASCFMPSVLYSRARGERGFTLVEMLVSIAVFMVVMTVAVGSLVSVIDANRKAQSVKSVMNNLSFALESMSKTIRVGSNYDAEGSSFTFLYPGDFDQDDNTEGGGDNITYRFNNDINGDGTGAITRSVEGGPEVAITAPEVQISKLRFLTSPAPEHARLLIVIDGVAGTKEKTKTTFSIQTTVTRIGF